MKSNIAWFTEQTITCNNENNKKQGVTGHTTEKIISTQQRLKIQDHNKIKYKNRIPPPTLNIMNNRNNIYNKLAGNNLYTMGWILLSDNDDPQWS